MYPNPQVDNHGIGNYENFERIIENNKDIDAIIVLDANLNRKNYQYVEKFYEDNKLEYNKKEYGDGIIVYEKSER